MRVMSHTETAARKMLQDMVNQGIMTQADANRLFNYGFSTVVATIANWRRRETPGEQIEARINRKITAARLRIAQATRANEKNLACRDLIIARMFAAVWQGMNEDVEAYSGR